MSPEWRYTTERIKGQGDHVYHSSEISWMKYCESYSTWNGQSDEDYSPTKKATSSRLRYVRDAVKFLPKITYDASKGT